MSSAVIVMAAVAAVFLILGLALLVALRRPGSAARTYAFRLVGVMATAFGVALATSAGFMWSWGPGR